MSTFQRLDKRSLPFMSSVLGCGVCLDECEADLKTAQAAFDLIGHFRQQGRFDAAMAQLLHVLELMHGVTEAAAAVKLYALTVENLDELGQASGDEVAVVNSYRHRAERAAVEAAALYLAWHQEDRRLADDRASADYRMVCDA